MKTIILALALIVLPSIPMASTLRVPSQYANIQLAINASSDADTILVSPGRYEYENGFDITGKSIHVVSEEGPAVTTIMNHGSPPMGENGSYAFNISSVPGPCTISGFTMTGHQPGDMSMNSFTIRVSNSNVRIAANVFIANYPQDVVRVEGASAPVIENNLFTANRATSILITGGASPTIEGNTFSANVWYEQIRIEGSSSHAVIRRNIIVNGKADCTPGPYCLSYGINALSPSGNIVIECNDVWNNASANYGGALVDQTGSNGNISQDPLFCGAAGSGNFYLRGGSPCAEPNVPAFCVGQRMGCFPVLCTVGTKEESWGSIKSLFGGNKK